MRNFCQFKMASSASTRWTWDDEKTQSSCKRDTKSRSHPDVKLAPVRVFPCKHPLNKLQMFLLHRDLKDIFWWKKVTLHRHRVAHCFQSIGRRVKQILHKYVVNSCVRYLH